MRNSTTIDDPDMNSYNPTSRQDAQALNHLIHQQQERMSMVFTSFIATYVTSKERWLHTQFFSTSPTGHLRYHPDDRNALPLRPRNADKMQDISPNFHNLAATKPSSSNRHAKQSKPSYQQS